jgi:hypothetical protein
MIFVHVFIFGLEELDLHLGFICHDLITFQIVVL